MGAIVIHFDCLAWPCTEVVTVQIAQPMHHFTVRREPGPGHSHPKAAIQALTTTEQLTPVPQAGRAHLPTKAHPPGLAHTQKAT